MSPRTGRRAGESGTRDAILEAARQRFAAHGYDGTGIRAIAADAGVDPALVHHYFGTKERLFVAAVGFPAVPSTVLDAAFGADRRRLGETILRTVLELWETADGVARLNALVRSAMTNEAAANMLRQFVTSAILEVVAERLDVADARYRASLVGSQVIGLAMTRYVFKIGPLSDVPIEDVVSAMGPTLQRYLTGRIV